jgi:hypothetical protein
MLQTAKHMYSNRDDESLTKVTNDLGLLTVCYVTVGTFTQLRLSSSVMKLEKSEFEFGLRVLSSK